jgi:hypothetical protein
MNDTVSNTSVDLLSEPKSLIADPYDEYNRILSERTDKLMNRVIPIYAPNRKGMPECVGTGNLITVSSRKFLLTAGHVIRDNHLQQRRTLYMPYSEGLISIEAQAQITGSDMPMNSEDPFDICAIELMADVASVLETTPYTFTSLNRERTTRFEATNFLLCFIGFPLSQNKVYSRKIRPHHYSYRSNVLSDTEVQNRIDDGTLASIRGISPATHYVMSFKKSTLVKTSGEKTNFPSMHGMSGSGLFTLSHRDIDAVLGDSQETSLVGLFQSGIRVDEDEMLLIFTNHLPILEIMRKFFP